MVTAAARAGGSVRVAKSSVVRCVVARVVLSTARSADAVASRQVYLRTQNF
jgi:uncharacterized protein (DUF169 family)